MNQKTKYNSRADQLPGYTLAKKFLLRFMKYKYHVPHNITTNNTIKTHKLPIFKWDRFRSSGSYDSKFNGYVLSAWFDRYSKIRDADIELLLSHIPDYYHDVLHRYLEQLDEIYNYIINENVDFKDYKLCYDLIYALVERFRFYKNWISDVKRAALKIFSHPLVVKQVKKNPVLNHQYHQVQRLHNYYIPRYNPRLNQQFRYPVYDSYHNVYLNLPK